MAIVPAADPSVDDPGGDAAFSFDLAGRLTSWTSPFGAEQVPASETHTTTYTLDDASNITAESVETATGVVSTRSATYERARLSAATDASFAPAGGPETTTTTTFTYSSIGPERTREATTTTAAGAPEVTDTRTTAYDPASHTQDIDHDRTIQGAYFSLKLYFSYDSKSTHGSKSELSCRPGGRSQRGCCGRGEEG